MTNSAAHLHADVTSTILRAAIAVHKEIGPGFPEHFYETALCVELDRCGVRYERQVPVHVRYRGILVGQYRLDLMIEGRVVLEIKAVEGICEAHLAVALAYLKATKLQVGLIVNFADSVIRSRRVFREPMDAEKEEKKD